MTGIGQTSVASTVQILSLVQIDNVFLEILFHVLPDHCLKYHIMIGREILKHGISIFMTANEVQFTRIKIVNTCELNL